MSTIDELKARGLWTEGAPLRLHLGCGEQRFASYVNIDFPAEQHVVMHVRPDYEADLLQLDFPSNSVDEVRLHHVFEHFSRVQALALLIRWHRWMKTGGILLIETPDFMETALAAAASSSPIDRMAFIRHLEGDQAMDWGFHIGQWYPERFVRTLTALGFEEVTTESSSTERWHRVGLRNVTARARRGACRSAETQLEAADAILWESTVADAETTTFNAWKKQLRDLA